MVQVWTSWLFGPDANTQPNTLYCQLSMPWPSANRAPSRCSIMKVSNSMKVNIATCASGLWPMYFFGSLDQEERTT